MNPGVFAVAGFDDPQAVEGVVFAGVTSCQRTALMNTSSYGAQVLASEKAQKKRDGKEMLDSLPRQRYTGCRTQEIIHLETGRGESHAAV